MPMPDETVRAVLLTSEAEIGDPKQLDALAMSFRATHDPREHALVLASTAKTPAAQKSWRAWAERRGAVVWFFAPEARTEIVVARFYAYLAYVRALRASRPSVNRVAMMDATDVIFNAPFMRAIPLDAIALVEEPATLKIGACEWHERWIRGCAAYGERVFARVANESRVCAGTIAGGIAATETFLTAFTNELTRTKLLQRPRGVERDDAHRRVQARARLWGGDDADDVDARGRAGDVAEHGIARGRVEAAGRRGRALWGLAGAVEAGVHRERVEADREGRGDVRRRRRRRRRRRTGWGGGSARRRVSATTSPSSAATEAERGGKPLPRTRRSRRRWYGCAA